MENAFDAREACAHLQREIIALRRQDNLMRWSLKAIMRAHPPFQSAVETMLDANIANMLNSDLHDGEIEAVQSFLQTVRAP